MLSFGKELLLSFLRQFQDIQHFVQVRQSLITVGYPDAKPEERLDAYYLVI